MALPSGTDLKRYLRIEGTAEDALLPDLIASATAHAESLIGRPILAREQVFEGLRARLDPYRRSYIDLPAYPVSAVTLKDRNGDTVDTEDYSFTESGRITGVRALYGHPYEATAMVGLDLASDFDSRIEPMLRPLILGIAAIFYKQRNPNASSDSGGGGVSVSYADNGDTAGLPPYLFAIVRQLRAPRVA